MYFSRRSNIFKLKQLNIPFITYNRKHKNNEFLLKLTILRWVSICATST